MCLHHFTKKTLKKENQEHGVHTKFRGYSILDSASGMEQGEAKAWQTGWAGASQGPPVRESAQSCDGGTDSRGATAGG